MCCNNLFSISSFLNSFFIYCFQIWPLKTSPRIQLMDRESICLPARIPSVFVQPPDEDTQRAAKPAPPTPSVANLPVLEKRKEVFCILQRTFLRSFHKCSIPWLPISNCAFLFFPCRLSCPMIDLPPKVLFITNSLFMITGSGWRLETLFTFLVLMVKDVTSCESIVCGKTHSE